MPALKINPAIKVGKYEKVYCHEDYAQELYNIYCGKQTDFPIGGKDLQKNQLLEITGIASITENEAYFEVNNMTSIPVDLNKEKRFFEFHNLTKTSFSKWLKSKEGEKTFLNEKNLLYITNSAPNVKGSLLGGFQHKIKEEFHKQIKNPTTAYEATIISKNQGGFIVDVFGISAFLPGGLAAANKIVEFNKYIGKTITVMVEDYLSDIDTFIMSNKKYIQHILPSLIAKFDTNVIHTGTITGSIKYGVFIEINEIFTGLLHTSKMNAETREKFEKNELKTGDAIECWVREIDKDCKLILTSFEPGTEKHNIEIGNMYDAKITAIKDFGIFIKLLKYDEIGLISSSTYTDADILNKAQGSIVNVKLKNIKGDKYYFELI